MEKIVCLLLLAFYGTRASSPAPTEPTLIRTTILSENYTANDGQFPYMVSFQRRFKIDSRGHKCGGVLITLQHVLTAARCLYDTSTGYPIDKTFYRVFAGHSDLSNDEDPECVRLIANYTIHPDFVGGYNHLNDIAILTLESPFIANYRIQPLPLPEQDDRPENHLYDDRMFSVFCTVSGWGETTSTLPKHYPLKYTPKSLVTLSECQTQYPQLFGITAANSSMVCAAAKKKLTYGCPGDEGNPLVCNNRLVGILTMSIRCGLYTDPQLYTRVSHYTTWALSVIEITHKEASSSSTFQPGVALIFILAVTQFTLL